MHNIYSITNKSEQIAMTELNECMNSEEST
jgi:hypothetical protein